MSRVLIMHIISPTKTVTQTDRSTKRKAIFASLRSLTLSWEFYLVVGVATFLRLYQFHTTEFDDDEAAVFQMAHNAVSHGFFVATANVASLHIFNPPAVIYIFMLPAFFTDDPIWGAITVAVLMIFSVVLTYIFVRRYYGRIAGTSAALSYATLFRAIVYSRFIWNQNLLPFFVILFIMVLFWGVVERRQGWFAPAVLLLGILLQLHGTGVFLAIPLLLACLLAPGTIRRRDIVLATLMFLFVYSTYILWEMQTHYLDLRLLLSASKQHAVINAQAWQFYQILFNPYDVLSTQNPMHWNIVPFLNETSFLYKLAPYFATSSRLLPYLIILSVLTLFGLALWSRKQPAMKREQSSISVWRRLVSYWTALRASPYRCGLLILLAWQVVPFVFLTRHSVTLYLHYLIFLLPGPFILLGIFLAQLMTWLRHSQLPEFFARSARLTLYVLVIALILMQFIGSTAGVIDLDRGNYDDGSSVNNLYNDLRSLRSAVNEADHVAQQRHIKRIYISTDWPTQSTLRFLSTQMQTPSTLFSDTGCIPLPGATEGPALMLIGPYSPTAAALITHFASATLISQPARAGGAPFNLFLVSTKPVATNPQSTLGHDLQLLHTPEESFSFNNTVWSVSRWQLLRSAAPDYRRVYQYSLTRTSGKQSLTAQCAFTAMRASDQVLLPFQQDGSATGQQASQQVSIQGTSNELSARYLHVGPLTFQTYDQLATPETILNTTDGRNQLFLQTA